MTNSDEERNGIDHFRWLNNVRRGICPLNNEHDLEVIYNSNLYGDEEYIHVCNECRRAFRDEN